MGNELRSWGGSSFQHTFVHTVRTLVKIHDDDPRPHVPLAITVEYSVGYSKETRVVLDPTCSKMLADEVCAIVRPLFLKSVQEALQRGVNNLSGFEWQLNAAKKFHRALQQHGFSLKNEFFVQRISIDAEAL